MGLSVRPGRLLYVLGELAADRVGDIDFAALERGQAGGLVGDHLEHEALHARRLAPILLEGLEDELDTRA